MVLSTAVTSREAEEHDASNDATLFGHGLGSSPAPPARSRPDTPLAGASG